MNKIGNVTFWKLDVRFLFENISLLAAQASVQILPVCSDVCRRAPSDCLFAAFLDKSRRASMEMHCAKVTALLATLTKNLKSAHFRGWIKREMARNIHFYCFILSKSLLVPQTNAVHTFHESDSRLLFKLTKHKLTAQTPHF